MVASEKPLFTMHGLLLVRDIYAVASFEEQSGHNGQFSIHSLEVYKTILGKSNQPKYPIASFMIAI